MNIIPQSIIQKQMVLLCSGFCYLSPEHVASSLFSTQILPQKIIVLYTKIGIDHLIPQFPSLL